MLESFVARLLNGILGKYVQELDTEGLNVGIFGGDVCLRGLRLKPSCLFELELPIEVGCGVIGQLKLIIPWNFLTTKPIQVVIEDVFILAHPIGVLPFDPDREKQLLRAFKTRIVEHIESGLLSSLQGLFSTVTPLLTHTVQLYVRGVHVRYEDPREALALGLILQEISLETTNSKWKPINSRSGNSSYQLVRADAFAVYINTSLHPGQFVLKDNEWGQHMREGLLQFQIKGIPMDFAVKPLNAKLKVILGRGDEASVLLLDVVIQDVVVALSHRQLIAVEATLDLFRRIPLHREFLSFRPRSPVKAHTAEWWRYFFKASLQQRVYPYTWARLMEFRRSYRDYRDLCKEVFIYPGDVEKKLDLQRCEDALPVHSIIIAREHAKIELRNSKPEVMEVVEVGNCCRFKPIRRSASYEMENIPLKFTEHKLNMTLDNVSLSLLRDGREVLNIALAQTLASLETRGLDAWKVSARAGNFLVEGASAENELVPVLATPANSHIGSTLAPCLSLDIEKKSLDANDATYWAVNVKLLPMELIYHEHAFSELLSWLPDVNWSLYFSTIYQRVNIFAGRSLVPHLDLHASIAVPTIVLPESGSLQKSGLVVVVDMGKWEVETDLQPRLTMEDVAEMTQMEIEERLYHRLNVTCSGAQVLFTDSGEAWREMARRDESEAHILSHLRTSITLSSSIKPDYLLLPRMKLNISVPTVHFVLSERRSHQLIRVISAMPIPTPKRGLLNNPVPLWPADRIYSAADVAILSDLAVKLVAFELSRQRTPDSLASPMATSTATDLGDLPGVSGPSVLSDTSEEEFELWARTVDLPGFEDNISPHNTITTLLRVTVGEFVCHLPRSVGYQDKPYLMLRVARISLDLAVMLYGPALQFTVGGFQVIDKLHIAPSGEYLEVISTQSDCDVFNLLYRKVSADCPDFKTHFHSVKESIVADVGRVALILQRDACLAMCKSVRDYVRVATKVPWTFSLVERFIDKHWMTENNPPLPPGATKLSCSFRIGLLSLRLREADADLLHLQNSGAEIDWALRGNERLVLRVYVKTLSVVDLSEAVLYPQVVTQDEDYVFEVKLVRFGPDQRLGLASGSIKVNLARLHILVAAHIFHVMQRFVSLLSKKVLCKIQLLVNSLLHCLPTLNGALQLSLSFNLPTILLPPGCAAPTLLIANLGDFTIENFLKKDGQGNVVDNLLLRLENCFVTRGLMTLSGAIESREEIMEPLRVTIDAKRVLSDVNVLDAAVNVDGIRMAIGQKDLSLILQLYAANRAFGKLFDSLKRWKNPEPAELRSLQAFLRDGNTRLRDASLRISLDSCVVTLYMDIDEQLSSPVRDQTHALCKLHVQDLICCLDSCVSGTCELRLSIHTCSLEDIRSDLSVIVKRVFGPRPGGDSRLDSAISVSSPPLVDVVGKQNERGDRCVDILVERTRLALSASFLSAIAQFCCDAAVFDHKEGCDNLGYVADTPCRTKNDDSCCSEQLNQAIDECQKGLSLSMQLRRPEIAVVAKEGAGLVIRCELLLDASLGPGRHELVLRMVGVKMSSLQPAPIVMRSCDVEIVRKLTMTGVQINIGMGALKFTLGSVALNACSVILDEMSAALRIKQDMSPSSPLDFLHLDDLWSPKKIEACCEAALCPITVTPGEVSCNEPHSFPVGAPSESLVVSMGTIKCVFGAQQGLFCRPMFIFKADCKLLGQDWSSAPTLSGTLSLEAACWNDNLQTWESFIEPWTISLEVYQNKALPISPCGGRGTRVRRSDDTPTAAPRDTSESSGDESEAGMSFLKPEHFHLDSYQACEKSLSDGADLEEGEDALERLGEAVTNLFVEGDETSDSDSSSDEVETESASSDAVRSPSTERAVFLNKHSDSVDSGLETETVDRQATHIVIQANALQISFNQNTIVAYQEMLSQRLMSSPPLLANYLGVGTRATLFKEGELLMRCGFDEDSLPGTPGTPSPCPSPTSSAIDEGRISPDFTFDRPDINALKKKISQKRILVEVPGDGAHSLAVYDVCGVKTFNLGSSKQVVVTTRRDNGVTHFEISSPLCIKNTTSYPISVYCKKSALEGLGETLPIEISNPFDDFIRLTVVAPDDVYHVPLAICYHCKLHFLPTSLNEFEVSVDGISWEDIGLENVRDIICQGKSDEVFCMRACWNESSTQINIVSLWAALSVKNCLPCACQIKLPRNQLRLEAGEESTVYCINLKQPTQLNLEVPDYMGQPWSGVLSLGPDCRDRLIVMATEKDTDGGNKHLAISVLLTRSTPASIILYAPYWILNKTGLPMQIRSSGSDIIQEWYGSGPLLFSNRKHKGKTVRIRILSSSWSPAFSLEAVGCPGLAVCRDPERKKKYRIVVESVACHVRPDLCRIVTFLPHITVENVSRKHLRFMEDNEKADLWHDIGPGQCVPFWPDTDSLRMVARLKDSKHVSNAFPVAQQHLTPLRMDKVCSLTVEVIGGEGHPMKVVFRPYRSGDAPVRIDNHCADLFLKFRQRGCPQVALISPYHSLLYTWDDPCKDRDLVWSVYNKAGGEVNVTLSQDACGEERITFRTVKTKENSGSRSSSPSSDSEPANSPVRRSTRKDTVIVYWTSFLQGRQRVLLLTQNERLARLAKRAVDAERACIELFVSISEIGFAVSALDNTGIERDLTYVCARKPPARWEICVGQRWKPFPAELSAWLENNHSYGVAHPKIKEIIQADLEKMQLKRPLFGTLRRRQRAAIWLQYRNSRSLSVLQCNLYRVHVDDQRKVANISAILQAAPSAGFKPAIEVAAMWRKGISGVDSVKFAALSVQEHLIHLEMDWLAEILNIFSLLKEPDALQCAMRRDIARMHSQLANMLEEEEGDFIVEQMHSAQVKLDLTIVPASSANCSTVGLPPIFASILTSVASASAPVSSLPLKLCALTISPGCWNPARIIGRVSEHYLTQLLQQLYVLVQGLNVLATPAARLATTISTQQDELALPEEFSFTARQESEARLTVLPSKDIDSSLPRTLWLASRAYPIGCSLGLSNLAMRRPRGPPGMGLEVFERGPGRTVCALLSTLQDEIVDPLALLADALQRYQYLGVTLSCRSRPPRFFSPIFGATPFSTFEAQGVNLLQSLCNGRYSKDVYWAHVPLSTTSSSLVLCTLQRLILVEQFGNTPQMELKWFFMLENISKITTDGLTMRIFVSQGNEVMERCVNFRDEEVLLWAHSRILEAKLLAQFAS